MAWFEHEAARIYYEEHGNGDPILLLPGFVESIDELSSLREAFVSAGYRVIAADLPGSGRSEPQPRVYTGTYFEEDARAFEALLKHLSLESAHLMGFSDGGEVALLMSATIPHIARSVAAWGAAGVISDPSGEIRESIYNMVDNPSPSMQSFGEYLIDVYGKDNARIVTQSFAKALGDIVERGGSISLSEADKITCPVLLIVGENDLMAPPTLVSQLAGHITKAEFITVENAAHGVHYSHGDFLAQTIINWLKKI